VIEGYRTKQQVKPDRVRDREAYKAALASRNKLIGAEVRVTIKTIGREWTALGNAVVHTDHAPRSRCHGHPVIKPIVTDKCRPIGLGQWLVINDL
jgi:hypothetical protein